MDIVSHEKRSKMMSNIRSSNTKPEILLRKILHHNGFRYRLHVSRYGIVPDIIIRKYKVVIFVNGCFWHRHYRCKYCTDPKSNIERWNEKFSKNQERDKKSINIFIENGWRVAVIWECWSKRKLNIEWLTDWIKKYDDKFISWPNVFDR